MAKSGSRLDLDHYLEALLRKTGALPGSAVLDQARAAGKFTPDHDDWWKAVRKAHGDVAGTRALIEVLLLHRHMTHEHVVAGLASALRAGALTADAVALQARRFAETDERPRLVERPRRLASSGRRATVTAIWNGASLRTRSSRYWLTATIDSGGSRPKT